MKKIAQKTGSLLLALALTASPAALAAETAGSGIYTAMGIQYAYSEAGVVHLYDETGKTIVATLGNGAKLTVTNGQKDGLTYVHFGSAAGWIKDEELYQQLPQNVTGEVSGSSAPANQLIPVQTTPLQQSGGDRVKKPVRQKRTAHRGKTVYQRKTAQSRKTPVKQIIRQLKEKQKKRLMKNHQKPVTTLPMQPPMPKRITIPFRPCMSRRKPAHPPRLWTWCSWERLCR